MDEFFSKKVCDRCGKPLTVRQMSRFNTDTLCLECAKEEESHPDYQFALDAEMAQVKAGNYNFSGVGWPGKNGRVHR